MQVELSDKEQRMLVSALHSEMMTFDFYVKQAALHPEIYSEFSVLWREREPVWQDYKRLAERLCKLHDADADKDVATSLTLLKGSVST